MTGSCGLAEKGGTNTSVLIQSKKFAEDLRRNDGMFVKAGFSLYEFELCLLIILCPKDTRHSCNTAHVHVVHVVATRYNVICILC